MNFCVALAAAQLFSIGFWQLNDDGTYAVDKNGDKVPLRGCGKRSGAKDGSAL